MDTRKYIYHPEKLKSNIEAIRKEFGSRLKDFELAYSFKTNCHPYVIEDVKKSGIKAEVVSTEEYEKALAFGWKDNEIIYNGVCKEKEIFYRCALAGGIVNIDGREELSWAEEYFEQNRSPLAIGLRLNFDVGNGIKSRFGIEVGSDLYEKIVGLSKSGKIIVRGQSCHFTATRQKRFWIRKVEGLAKAVMDFPSGEYLDFGGSLAGSYEKVDPRKKSAGEEIDFASIAEALSETLRKYGQENKKIILECGTAVVGSAFDIEGTVLSIKESGFVVLDVSFKDMIMSSIGDSLLIEVVSGGRNQEMLRNYTLTGCTCLENDIIKKGFNGKLAIGDRLVFKNTGAYTLCFANSFIKAPLGVVFPANKSSSNAT